MPRRVPRRNASSLARTRGFFSQIISAVLSGRGIVGRLQHKRFRKVPMLYAILCYHDEDFVGSWSKEQDEAVMKKLAVVQEGLAKQGRLGPVARLLPTTAA